MLRQDKEDQFKHSLHKPSDKGKIQRYDARIDTIEPRNLYDKNGDDV